MFGPYFVRQCDISSFTIISLRKRELVALIVFLLSCGSWCSVALPHVAVFWSAVCDCATSCTDSLTFCLLFMVPWVGL